MTDGTEEATEDTADAEEARPPQYMPPREDEFDWRGWLLVGVIVISFLVIPGIILALPYIEGVVDSIGLSYRQAYLALPMIPALLLGSIAVWAAVRSRTAE